MGRSKNQESDVCRRREPATTRGRERKVHGDVRKERKIVRYVFTEKKGGPKKKNYDKDGERVISKRGAKERYFVGKDAEKWKERGKETKAQEK